MPIRRGQALGIDCCWPAPGQFFATVSSHESAQLFVWTPPLADDGQQRYANRGLNAEVTFNADIEPNSAFTITGVRRTKKNGVLVSAVFPNAGTVQVGDASDPSLGGSPSGRSHRGPILRTTGHGFGELSGAPPFSETFVLPPTKRARRLLKARGKLTGTLKVVYTPRLGSAVTQTTRFRLKK